MALSNTAIASLDVSPAATWDADNYAASELDAGSNKCSNRVVGKTEPLALYGAGYDDAQAMCLTTGSTQAARRWVEEHPHADSAYLSGFDWGLYDFEDANGLRHERRTAG